jgi:hypothetical protein
MLNKKAFGQNIISVLETLSFPIYVIHKYRDYYCTCANFSTKQGDIHCKKCLGYGLKIKIAKTLASIQPSSQGNTMRLDHMHNYKAYMKYPNMDLEVGDSIVFGNHAGYIQVLKPYYLEDYTPLYYECAIAPMKQDTKIFLKNFYEVIDND